MAMPSATPKTAAMAKPTTNSLRLTSRCRPSTPVPASFRNLAQMSDSGARISGQLPLRPAISQATPTTTRDSKARALPVFSWYQRTRNDWRGSTANGRSRAASAMGLRLEGLVHQAHVDELHRIRGQVLDAGALEVLDELLHGLLVDVEVLRGHFALDDVQVVGAFSGLVTHAHRLFADSQHLVLVLGIVEPLGDVGPGAEEVHRDVFVFLVPALLGDDHQRLDVLQRSVVVGVVDLGKALIAQLRGLRLELGYTLDGFRFHGQDAVGHGPRLHDRVLVRLHT